MKYLLQTGKRIELLEAPTLSEAEELARNWICRTFADRPEATLFELREVSLLSFAVRATRIKEVQP